jgi:DNA replication and repair protein RecF
LQDTCQSVSLQNMTNRYPRYDRSTPSIYYDLFFAAAISYLGGMRLDSLMVTNFRNFETALIRPGQSVNIFYGGNGSGKTNLLEAIFTLCLGRSQRGARDLMLVHENDAGYFRLEGKGEVEGREVRLTCAYEKGGRKKITIDDNPARVSKLFELLSVISMAPEDVTLFSGPPSNRRRFLDIHQAQASPSYLADLTDYSKALAQKNSFLKNNPGQECPFDPLLIEYGARIMTARHRFIQSVQSQAPGYYDRITGESKTDEEAAFRCAYAPNVPFAQKEEIAGEFNKRLADNRRREEALETAVVGPHRDDVEFYIGRFPARGYGSQGEMRSAAAAVMMAAADYLESRRREKPILLLDEIFAELDHARRDNLARLFDAFEQIFLTTAVEPPPALNEQAVIFHIENGKVERG